MSSKLKVDTRVTVETPEGVDFQFQVAGPGKRATSFVMDTLLKCGIVAIAFFFVALTAGFSEDASKVAFGATLIVWFAMSWLYGSCFEAFWNGQTPGKKSQNLRVVRTNGTPIGWFEAFGRNLLLVADGMLVLGPFALNTVGLLTMSSNRRMQRLGDLFFDTMVIDESREFISRAPGITHGVERIPRSQCNGRFHVPERTLAVIERLFEGDRLISDGRREEIARNLALTLRSRLGFEEPGPNAANPNEFFVQSPIKSTVFLKRVLKTFSEDPGSEVDSTTTPRKPSRGQNERFSTNKEDAFASLVVDPKPASTKPASTKLDDVILDAEYLEDDDEPQKTPTSGLPQDWRTS